MHTAQLGTIRLKNLNKMLSLQIVFQNEKYVCNLVPRSKIVRLGSERNRQHQNFPKLSRVSHWNDQIKIRGSGLTDLIRLLVYADYDLKSTWFFRDMPRCILTRTTSAP